MTATLTATLAYDYGSTDYDYAKAAPRVVTVHFGETLIATLPPVRESRAGHGDDSTFFDAEDRAIVEETVAPYLARLFTVAPEVTA